MCAKSAGTYVQSNLTKVTSNTLSERPIKLTKPLLQISEETEGRTNGLVGDVIDASKGVQGGPTMTSRDVPTTSVLPNANNLVSNSEFEVSGTSDGLRLTVGAKISVPSSGYDPVGGVIPESVPVLKLQGFVDVILLEDQSC